MGGPKMPALLKSILLVGAFVLGLAIAVAVTNAGDRWWSDAFWVSGKGSSCDLACGAAFSTKKLEAFRSGHYLDSETHYTICRTMVGKRPGFQHQAGSPNVCKVHGFEPARDYECLCKL